MKQLDSSAGKGGQHEERGYVNQQQTEEAKLVEGERQKEANWYNVAVSLG